MKLTSSQEKILGRNYVRGYQNMRLYPIFKAGEHRSAVALENRGYGKKCASQTRWEGWYYGYYFGISDSDFERLIADINDSDSKPASQRTWSETTRHHVDY